MNEGQSPLTRAVLDAIAAEEGDDGPQLPDERLRAAIFGREPLTPPERRILARSAATRARFARLRDLERARALTAWQAQGIAPRPLEPLAAADGVPAVAPLRLGDEHFGIALTPVDAEGREWHIALQVAPALAAATPGGFRLIDSEGLVWLSGHPDGAGRLCGYWRGDEPLWERAHRVGLDLLPM